MSSPEVQFAEWARVSQEARSEPLDRESLITKVRELWVENDRDGYMEALPPLHQVLMLLGDDPEWDPDAPQS